MAQRYATALLALLLAGGSAHAQCADTDKIFIDPQLAPQRRARTICIGDFVLKKFAAGCWRYNGGVIL